MDPARIEGASAGSAEAGPRRAHRGLKPFRDGRCSPAALGKPARIDDDAGVAAGGGAREAAVDECLPLGDEELGLLDRFLETRCAPAGGIADVEMLDGYCCALATAPVPVPVETWLPAIWGDESAFGSGAEDAAARALIERFHAEVLARIAADPPAEDDDEARAARLPLVLDDPEDPEFVDPPDGRSHFAEIWALGFEFGYGLADAAWDAARADSPAVDELLSMLAALLANVDDGAAAPVGAVAEAAAPLDTEGRLAVLYALPDLLHRVRGAHAARRPERARPD